MTRSRRWLTYAIAGGGLVLLLAFSFAPHYAAWSMKRAADANDLQTFARYVDLQSVRESLKAAREKPGLLTKGLAGRVASRARRLTLGLFTDRLVDRLVTYERLARAIRGEPRSAATRPAAASRDRDAAAASEATADDAGKLDVAMGYEGANRFAITVRDPKAGGEPVVLVFARRGVFAWQLAAIRM